MVPRLYFPRTITSKDIRPLMMLTFYRKWLIEFLTNTDPNSSNTQSLIESLPIIHVICLITATTAPNGNREALEWLTKVLKQLNFSDANKLSYGMRFETYTYFLLGEKYIPNIKTSRTYAFDEGGKLIITPSFTENETLAIKELSDSLSNYTNIYLHIQP